MSAIPKKRRRLQVSLRMLLVLMALVGVALTIYRWPWVVTTREPVYEVSDPYTEEPTENKLLFEREYRTTFRRNWRFEAVRSGPRQVWRDGRLEYEANYYEGQLHGPRRAFDEQGRLFMEATYREGQLNGPFRAGDGTKWIWQGNYQDDEMHGTWQGEVERRLPAWQTSASFRPPDFDSVDNGTYYLIYENPRPNESLIFLANWNKSKRHGLWTWKGPDGDVLHTAEYVDDELHRWNGEPVVEQFRHWLRGLKLGEPALIERLETEKNDNWRFDELISPLCYRLSFSEFNTAERYLVFIEAINVYSPLYPPLTTSSPIPWLCEFALVNGYRFDCRYGSLWLVPGEADPSPPFVDPTGVDLIEFEAGSEQARDWNARIEVMSNEHGFTRECVEQLLKGTLIAWNCDAIADFQPAANATSSSRLFTLRRRDALGLVLYRTGCRCERDGTTLRILPRRQRSTHDILLRPLKAPVLDPFG